MVDAGRNNEIVRQRLQRRERLPAADTAFPRVLCVLPGGPLFLGLPTLMRNARARGASGRFSLRLDPAGQCQEEQQDDPDDQGAPEQISGALEVVGVGRTILA